MCHYYRSFRSPKIPIYTELDSEEERCERSEGGYHSHKISCQCTVYSVLVPADGHRGLLPYVIVRLSRLRDAPFRWANPDLVSRSLRQYVAETSLTSLLIKSLLPMRALRGRYQIEKKTATKGLPESRIGFQIVC